MLILALDLARRTGWSFGEAGSAPRAGTWELREPHEDLHLDPGRLCRRLIETTRGRRPDLVAVEDYMQPHAQKHQQALIGQMLLHGALLGWAGASGLRLVRVAASTVRRHVCGKASAGDRDSTKAMVRDRMVALGLAPRGTTDTDMTDALAVWRWAEDTEADVRGAFALVTS